MGLLPERRLRLGAPHTFGPRRHRTAVIHESSKMLHEPRKQPLMRQGFGLAMVVFAGCLGAASASSSLDCPTAHSPSNFDYLVLASIADSPRLPAMAGY